MRPLEALYILIRSLTPAEVESFRLFAATQHDAVHADQVNLFEALHDETRKSSGHVARMQVDADTAKDLDESLHRHLRIRAEAWNPAARVRHLMDEHRLLMDRSLYDLADRRLDQAMELALHYERFYDALEIVNLRKSRLGRVAALEEAVEERRKLEAEEAQVLDRLVNYINWRNAAKEVHEALRMPDRMDPGSKREVLDALFDRPLLRDIKTSQSETARYHFWHLRCTYYYFIGDLQRAWEASGKLLKLIAEHPFLVQGRTDAMALAWFNHLSLALELGQFEAFEKLMQEFRALPETEAESRRKQAKMLFEDSGVLLPGEEPKLDTRLEAIVNIRASFLDLKQLLFQGRVDEGLVKAKAFDRRTSAFGERLDPYFRAQFPYLLAYFQYLSGELDEASQTIERVLTLPDLRDDVKAGALVMRQLLAFDRSDGKTFQLGHMETIGFFSQSHREQGPQRQLLEVLGSALQDQDPNRMMQRLIGVRDQLLRLSGDPFERNHLPPFDWLAWLESKISGEPFLVRFLQREGREAYRVIR
jgi:hypothetical protein